MSFSITRDEIKQAALSLRGVPFLHQGRDPKVGLDCVGLLVALGERLGYQNIEDKEAYKRIPSASEIRKFLEKNLDEIPPSEVGVGDIFLMRMHGRKPRHTSICIETRNDPLQNLYPSIIHANYDGVRLNMISDFPKAWYVAGFRVRGLTDG